MGTAQAMLTTLRPRQWVKNAFVLAPLVFSKHLADTGFLLRAGLAALAFCAISGAVYAFNDVRDIDADRAHPIKKNRPIAAGALSIRGALLMAGVLAAIALATTAVLSLALTAILVGYLVNNVAYSLYLKRFPFVDVLLIATGFILRVLAGGYAIDVPVSVWLVACTALLSAMLGFGKRAHELALEGDDGTTRKSLVGYNLRQLRFVMFALAAATCAAYALYTQDQHTVAFFGTRSLIWTLPFCALGIARFAQLALFSRTPLSPTDAMLRDMPFIANILVWGAVVLYIIYG